MSRELRVDGSTGNLQFFDQRTGELVATLPTVTEGFVQVTMRNLGRLRTTAGHRADAPYRLQRHATGHVVLVDPETGTKISLNAFGPTNAQAFAQLLQGGKS
jgi:putative photosynthetic complex assembly protein